MIFANAEQPEAAKFYLASRIYSYKSIYFIRNGLEVASYFEISEDDALRLLLRWEQR
jgi:hypothetical protein